MFVGSRLLPSGGVCPEYSCRPWNTVVESVNDRAKAARTFKAATNSKHNLPVAPNLMQQDFAATAANQKLAGDITYLWTNEGWLYLSVFVDLYSRLVVSSAMPEDMTGELACDALNMLLWRPFPNARTHGPNRI